MPGVTVLLDAADLAVGPGDGAAADLRVCNTTGATAEFRFEIVGPAGNWGYVSPPRLTLAPDQTGTARLSFQPGRSPDVAPGPVGFQVRVLSTAEPSAEAVVDGVVTVGPFADMAATLGPARPSGRMTRHRLGVQNRGNVALRATIEPSSTQRGMIVRAAPAQVELAPGAAVEVEVTARSWRPSFRRPSRAPTLRAVVRPEEGTGGPVAEAAVVEAAMAVRPARRVGPLVAGLLGMGLAAGFVVTRGGDDPVDGGAAPPVAVGLHNQPLVDTSRPTASRGTVPEAPDRALPTVVFYPATGPAGGDAVEGAPPAVEGGPYPMIVFAHRSSGVGDQRYGPLMRAWAARGYVVAAPTFPFEADPENRILDDYPNQPADMSFVARELVRLGADQASPLRGMIDGEHIGAAGVGLGGITTLGLVANTCCQDPLFTAAAVMAANQAAFGDGEYFRGKGPPLLVLHGDRDETIPYADARKTFGGSPRPAYLVTHLGSGHGGPFLGPIEPPANAVTMASTLAFFDRYLKGDEQALDRLRAVADVPGVARFEERD